jgi:putative oxidoreductase
MEPPGQGHPAHVAGAAQMLQDGRRRHSGARPVSILFRSPTAAHVDLVLLVLRIPLGIIFVAHGAQKVFVHGLAGVTEGFAGMGVPLPGLVAPFIALLELVGGVMLILGVLTRPVALLLLFEMLGALFIVHLAAGFFLPRGYEFVLILAAVALAIVIAGAGAYSIDGLLGRRRTAAHGLSTGA